MYLEKIKELVSVIVRAGGEDTEEDLDLMSNAAKSFVHYVNVVAENVALTPIIREKFEGNSLIYELERMDRLRRASHEAAISYLKILNRLCKAYSLEPFTDLDTSDRYAVADFCAAFTSEMFETGQPRSMDEIAYGSRNPFDERRVTRYIEEAR